MNGLYVYSLTDLNKSLRQVENNNLEAKKENLQYEESKGTVHTKEFHFKTDIDLSAEFRDDISQEDNSDDAKSLTPIAKIYEVGL